MEITHTVAIYFKDLETGVEMEFEPNVIELAKWLGVRVVDLVSVLDYGWQREDWTAERIIGYP